MNRIVLFVFLLVLIPTLSRAQQAGTVVEVKVPAGDQVPQGRLLVVVDPDESPDAGGNKVALAAG